MSYLGHVPRTGNFFDWGLHTFEVVDMDDYRVDKVLISPLSEEKAAQVGEKS